MKENKETLFPYLNEQGDRLAKAVNTFCEERQIGATLDERRLDLLHALQGAASRRRATWPAKTRTAQREFDVHLLNKGVIVPGIHLFFTSAAHTPDHIDQVAEAFQDSLMAVREDGSRTFRSFPQARWFGGWDLATAGRYTRAWQDWVYGNRRPVTSRTTSGAC